VLGPRCPPRPARRRGCAGTPREGRAPARGARLSSAADRPLPVRGRGLRHPNRPSLPRASVRAPGDGSAAAARQALIRTDRALATRAHASRPRTSQARPRTRAKQAIKAGDQQAISRTAPSLSIAARTGTWDLRTLHVATPWSLRCAWGRRGRGLSPRAGALCVCRTRTPDSAPRPTRRACGAARPTSRRSRQKLRGVSMPPSPRLSINSHGAATPSSSLPRGLQRLAMDQVATNSVN
jgi:hypothetical protein